LQNCVAVIENMANWQTLNCKCVGYNCFNNNMLSASGEGGAFPDLTDCHSY